MKFISRSHIIVVVAVFVALSALGFQCSSPNITGAQLYYQQYISSKDKDRLELAMDAIQKEIKANPANATAYYWKGVIHGAKEEFAEMKAAVQKARDINPEPAADLKREVNIYWAEAFNYGTQQFIKGSNNPIASKKRQMLLEAKEAYDAAIFLNPKGAAENNGYVMQGLALSELAKVTDDKSKSVQYQDAAEASFKRQIQMGGNPDAYNRLSRFYLDRGSALNQAGDSTAAQEQFSMAIETAQNGLEAIDENTVLTDSARTEYKASLNNALLNTYLFSGKAVEQEQVFADNAKNNPNDPVSQYIYGIILREKKDYEKSVEYLNKAIELDKTFEDAYLESATTSLIYATKLRNDVEQSPEKTDELRAKADKVLADAKPHVDYLLTTALKESKDKERIYLVAGEYYIKTGETKKAEEMYKKADEAKAGN